MSSSKLGTTGVTLNKAISRPNAVIKRLLQLNWASKLLGVEWSARGQWSTVDISWTRGDKQGTSVFSPLSSCYILLAIAKPSS